MIVRRKSDGKKYFYKREFGRYTQDDTTLEFLSEFLIAKSVTSRCSIVFVNYLEYFKYNGTLYFFY